METYKRNRGGEESKNEKCKCEFTLPHLRKTAYILSNFRVAIFLYVDKIVLSPFAFKNKNILFSGGSGESRGLKFKRSQILSSPFFTLFVL